MLFLFFYQELENWRIKEQSVQSVVFYGNDIAIDLHDLPLTPPVGGEQVSFIPFCRRGAD